LAENWHGHRRCNGLAGPESRSWPWRGRYCLWDLRAKHAELPLWKFLGGGVEFDDPRLQQGYRLALHPARSAQRRRQKNREEEGFRRLKLKVGSVDPAIDLKRIRSVPTPSAAR